MIVRTMNSVYEISLAERRFRRTDGRPDPAAPAVGAWQPFDEIGPVEEGRPMRFYWSKEPSGGLGRFGLLTTGRVVRVLDEGSGDEHLSRTFRPQTAGHRSS